MALREWAVGVVEDEDVVTAAQAENDRIARQNTEALAMIGMDL